MYAYKVERRSKWKKVLLFLLTMAIVSFFSIKIYDMYLGIEVKSYGSSGNSLNNTQTEVDRDENKIEQILEETTKNVVGISKIKNNGSSVFSSKTNEESLGLGSGVIVSENGYIVTNWHVAGNKYSNCYVTLENGTMYNGNVVWADSNLDLAIVKINVKGLSYMSLGDSENIKVGQSVYAIGNPIGYEFQRTVTSGIISGTNRTIKIEDDNTAVYMENLIQTDATINPGNSGGALINTNGEMIGINSVKITDAEGIGFAIPINIIKPIIEKFSSENKFEEAYIGIFAYDKEVIPYLDSSLELDCGIYVADVAVDGPARKSGLQVKDIITKIDGQEINKMSELRNYIYKKKPNDTVTLTILRNKKQGEIQIKLGQK